MFNFAQTSNGVKITFNKLNISGIKTDKVKMIPWILGSHAFLIILFLILFNLIAGVLLFYKYVILVEIEQQKIVEKNIKFEYNAYQEVLKGWKMKEQKLEESPDKIHLNPFI